MSKVNAPTKVNFLTIIAYIILSLGFLLLLLFLIDFFDKSFRNVLVQKDWDTLMSFIILFVLSFFMALIFFLPGIYKYKKDFAKFQAMQLERKVLAIMNSTDKITFEKLYKLVKEADTSMSDVETIAQGLVANQKYNGFINWEKRYIASGKFYHMDLICSSCSEMFRKSDIKCSTCGAPKGKALRI
jgi:hypothetical protein